MNNRPFTKGGSKASATSKIELFVIIVNGFQQHPRTAAISKMELFVIMVYGFQPLTIITESSTLEVAAAFNPPLVIGLLFTIHPLFVNKV